MKTTPMLGFLLEQLDDPKVRARAMFGGHGIYSGNSMFGIVYEEKVYMKVADREAEVSEQEPFRPNPRQTIWSFRCVPAGELDNPAQLRATAARAKEAAAQSKR